MYDNSIMRTVLITCTAKNASFFDALHFSVIDLQGIGGTALYTPVTLPALFLRNA
jgi:hypothetical protein